MKTLLIDGTNNFIRCYAVIPTLNNQGRLNGGVVGFLRSLAAFVHLCTPDKVVIIWDGQGGSAKRRAIIKNYKEGRKPIRLNRDEDFVFEDAEKNKVYQRVRLGEYLNDLPVYQMSIPDIEADDVIAYLAHLSPDEEKIIISGDKDMYQLISDKVRVYAPIKKEFVSDQMVFEKYGVHCNNFAIARAITGDESDNLSGVKGIGFKTLIKMFPMMSGSEKVALDQLFQYARENGEKYQRFLECTQLVMDNYQVMQLENPIIGLTSIQKIENAMEKHISFNATSVRMKILEDGITTFSDSFYQPFRGIMANLISAQAKI